MVPSVVFITGVICLLKQDQQSYNANIVVSSDNVISLLGWCDSHDLLMSHITDTIFIGETFSCVLLNRVFLLYASLHISVFWFFVNKNVFL